MGQAMSEQISPPEASKLESELVFKRFEPRMMIALERARRAAIRNGSDELKAILCDEQVTAMFGEVVAEASRAGLGWTIILDGIGNGPDAAAERAREHYKRVREAANHWLASIVVRRVPGLRLPGHNKSRHSGRVEAAAGAILTHMPSARASEPGSAPTDSNS
jgi:hypothetical protein